MPAIEARPLPPDSLLARHSQASDTTDCYACEVPGEVGLEAFVEAFYTSAGFLPERLILGLIGRGARDADARALARGEATRYAAWTVEARTERELLLADYLGHTRSWLMAEPLDGGRTRLCFGSGIKWRGKGDRLFRALLPFHAAYSRVLLGAAVRGLRKRDSNKG
jgi:hypothetical protein